MPIPFLNLPKAVLALAFLPCSVAAQKLESLHAGKTKTETIAKSDTLRFLIRPQTGKIYTLDVEQRGIDIAMHVQSLKGRKIASMDSPNGMYGPESIRYEAVDDSAIVVLIAPLPDSANAARGKVSLRFTEKKTSLGDINPVLTPKQMRRDLKVFLQIRQQVNSGFLRYRSKAFMDSLYADAGRRSSRPMRLTEFYKIVMDLTDAEGSCHNNTYLPEEPLAYLPADRGFFPYYLRYVDSQMLMNHDGEPIPLGARILSINGHPDTVLMRRFSKYLPTDGYNETAKRKFSVDGAYGWRYPLEFGVQDSFRIVYRAHGETTNRALTIPSVPLAEKRALYQRRHSAPFEAVLDNSVAESYNAAMLDSSTALLRFRRFDMAGNGEDPAYAVFCGFLDSVFSTIKQKAIPNLVVDVRNNPGGSDPNYEKVFTYLTERPFRENTLAYINFGEVPLPQHYRWSSAYPENQKREEAELNALRKEIFAVQDGLRFLQTPARNPVYYPDSANHFSGNLYLLIDENVASAASHFASLVRAYSNATIVGMETTGGYYGHNGHFPMEYVLPESKIRTRFSIVWVEQDVKTLSSQPVGRGIIPDVEVEQSYADFLLNEDTQLKAVMEMIEERAGG